jgi:RNA-binding proteins (RRM domain)
VFEPFGDLEFVDLHRDPMTGRSKGYAFVQCVDSHPFVINMFMFFLSRYKRAEDAKMALEQMEGFELAGRTVSSSLVDGCFLH